MRRCRFCGKKGVTNRNTISSYTGRMQKTIRKMSISIRKKFLKPVYKCKYCHGSWS
jgi:hypothetical protein